MNYCKFILKFIILNKINFFLLNFLKNVDLIFNFYFYHTQNNQKYFFISKTFDKNELQNFNYVLNLYLFYNLNIFFLIQNFDYYIYLIYLKRNQKLNRC